MKLSDFIRSRTLVHLIFVTVYLQSNVGNSLTSLIKFCWTMCDFMWLTILQFNTFTSVYKCTLYTPEKIRLF